MRTFTKFVSNSLVYSNVTTGKELDRMDEAILIAECAARQPSLQGDEGGPARDLVGQLKEWQRRK